MGNWVIVELDQVVTYKDGYEKKSKHNMVPKSHAIDIVPYPINWKDINRFYQLNGVVETVQRQLLARGTINKLLEWGGLWNNFKDYPHYQL